MNRTIAIRGARAGALAEVDMDLPLGRVICFTGRCRGGRRAMALDVLYAESRRRYMQALAPVEREGLRGTGQVEVESVAGLPPAIHLNSARRGRTVGDYLQLEAHLVQIALENGRLRCPVCGGECRGYSPDEVEAAAAVRFPDERCLVLAPLSLQGGADWSGVWRELRAAGFMRLKIGGAVVRLEGDDPLPPPQGDDVQVVVDRLVPAHTASVRFLEAVRVSRSIAAGRTVVESVATGETAHFNQPPTCADCGREFEEVAAEDLFSGRDGVVVVTLQDKPMDELLELPLADLLDFVGAAGYEGYAMRHLTDVLAEACDMGLGALHFLQRLETLAGGEWQRLQVVACLGSGLTGILYIFEGLGDQLYRADAEVVVAGLRQLSARGNTALVLDHNPDIVACADEVWGFAAGRPVPDEAPTGSCEAARRSSESPGADVLAVSGDIGFGSFSCEFPHGGLTCISGASGSGKSRLLHEVVAPALKGRKVGCEVRGAGRNNRVVEVGDAGKRATVVEELGVFAAIADVYAASAAAQASGWGRDAFLLDKPGGRCASCEGRGFHYFDLEFLEDISLVCETCGGSRYREEVAEITLRGVSMADVLEMDVESAGKHFAREKKVRRRFEAALDCGLGYVRLGLAAVQLEPGEWLRLRLAVESTRVSGRTWVIVDEPACGDHADDLALTTTSLQGLTEGGATVVVADQHPAIIAAADAVVELS